MTPADLTLIVAAGGMSTRMGEDKRFLPMADGETLLSRTLRRGRTAGFRTIVLAAEGERRELTELAAAYGAHLVTDDRPQQGPAAAIAAGLAAAETEWSLVLSGDMPFYDFDLVRALLPEARGAVQVVLPTLAGYWQPLAALYRRDAGQAFAAAIARGDRKLGIILRGLTVRELPLAVDAGLFFNVNTPAAYRLACGRIANEGRERPILSVGDGQDDLHRAAYPAPCGTWCAYSGHQERQPRFSARYGGKGYGAFHDGGGAGNGN